MKEHEIREMEHVFFKMRIILTSLQWERFKCPVCNADVRDGHQGNCELATVLAEAAANAETRGYSAELVTPSNL